MKDTIKNMKSQATDWRKPLHIQEKRLDSKIYKELKTQQENEQPSLKMSQHLNRHLFKEDIQKAIKHMEKCSTTYVIREMQTKTIRYHDTCIQMSKIQNTDTTKH